MLCVPALAVVLPKGFFYSCGYGHHCPGHTLTLPPLVMRVAASWWVSPLLLKFPCRRKISGNPLCSTMSCAHSEVVPLNHWSYDILQLVLRTSVTSRTYLKLLNNTNCGEQDKSITTSSTETNTEVTRYFQMTIQIPGAFVKNNKMSDEAKIKACTPCTDLHAWNFNKLDFQILHLILLMKIKD